MGEFCRRLMVVGDDDIDIAADGLFNLRGRGDPAIDGDEQFALIGDCIFQGIEDHALFKCVAVGDVKEDIGSDKSQKFGEEGCGCDAVDIVVAIDEDVFFVFEGF